MHRKRISRMLAMAVLAMGLAASIAGAAYPDGNIDAWGSSLKSGEKMAARPKERGEKSAVDAEKRETYAKESEEAEAEDPDIKGRGGGSETKKDMEPDIGIYFIVPKEWQEDRATVRIEVKDLAGGGEPQLESVQARAGRDQEWTDVTERMAIEITENCAIHVRATDWDGKTYEDSCFATCFDHEPPTVGAAVVDGLLHITVEDDISGAAAAYVNGYGFTELEDGKLDIRLQKFDAGYGYFKIQAEDGAGNLSAPRFVQNPYFQGTGAKGDGKGTDLSSLLPSSAMPTAPAEATATVTDHVLTDSSGNVTGTATSRAYSLGAADPVTANVAGFASAAESTGDTTHGGTGETGDSGPGQGREFYTIQTESGKVFYLVIGRDGTQEDVHFLTDITENDLLNATSDNSATLPQNSAVPDSGIGSIAGGAQEEAALFQSPEPDAATGEAVMENGDGMNQDGAGLGEPAEKRRNPAGAYAICGVLAALVLGAAYYFKKKAADRDGDFLEDEDEEEEYESEDEEEESDGDGFFAQDPPIDDNSADPDGGLELADEGQAWRS